MGAPTAGAANLELQTPQITHQSATIAECGLQPILVPRGTAGRARSLGTAPARAIADLILQTQSASRDNLAGLRSIDIPFLPRAAFQRPVGR
jgi:hypothetical protein